MLSALAPIEERVHQGIAHLEELVGQFVAEKRSLCTSSSFQTHSVPLLHMLSRLDARVPVYFLDTGYHFVETLRFRDDVAESLGLTLVVLDPDIPKVAQRDASGLLLFASDPDRCCHLNKVRPMEQALQAHDVWITGVRAVQTATRAAMSEVETRSDGLIRCNPVLGWDDEMIEWYRDRFGLPAHPLERASVSIGCAPCTMLNADGRQGRWSGMTKTECGLHL